MGVIPNQMPKAVILLINKKVPIDQNRDSIELFGVYVTNHLTTLCCNTKEIFIQIGL